MKNNIAFYLIILISFASIFATGMLGLKAKNRKRLKYLPALVIAALAILFCIIMTIIQYSVYGREGYIVIIYIVALIVSAPAVIFSLLTAAIFDISERIRKER